MYIDIYKEISADYSKAVLRFLVLIYLVLLISDAYCREIPKNIEHLEDLNVTTLYPVENITFHVRDDKQNETSISEEDEKFQETLDNISTKLIKKDCDENNEISKFYSKEFNDGTQIEIDNIKIKQNSKNNVKSKSLRGNTTAWNIDAGYSSSKLKNNHDANVLDVNNNTKIETEGKGKEFKPSPSLGSFYDEDSFVIPTERTKIPFFPLDKPSSGFISSPRDFIQLQYKKPIDMHKPIDAPYKFEDIPNTNDWVFQTGLEQTPTVEAPVKIPAGGLYGKPDVFREKPSTDGDDDDFGLDFVKDEKTNPVKKRGNPWKNLLNFVTALIPVGIIISALTPNIITIENTDNNPYYPSRFSRRSGSVADLPPISERCKRRLLCELHSDINYERNIETPKRQKHCYKIQCDDPQALGKVLRWLLFRNSHKHPSIQDRRGYIT